MPSLEPMKKVIEKANRDGRSAAVSWFNSQTDRKKYPYKLHSDPEIYGFRQKYSTPMRMNYYRSRWSFSFELKIRELFRKMYADRVHPDDVIRKHDLVEISDDSAWDMYNADPDHFELFIMCYLCGNVSAYAGYPAVPVNSTVMCLTCGYIQVGGTKYVPRKSIKGEQPPA